MLFHNHMQAGATLRCACRMCMTDGDAVRCSWLQAGATVCIGAASDAACGSTHTVKAGDSCWAIWSSKGLTESQLYGLNPGVNCSLLKVRVCVCNCAHSWLNKISLHGSVSANHCIHKH